MRFSPYALRRERASELRHEMLAFQTRHMRSWYDNRKEELLVVAEEEHQHGCLSSYQIGDYVAHRTNPDRVFKVVEILESVHAKIGDHLLGCVLEQHVRKYHERDLVRVGLDPDEMW